MDLRGLLEKPDRRWEFQRGATESEIEQLLTASPVRPPESFLALLRCSNGGEGDIALPPLLFVLDPVKEILSGLADSFLQEELPGFMFFGGNGGLERIAFDLRGPEPWPVVMIDPIAGPESAVVIASTFDQFLSALGLESP